MDKTTRGHAAVKSDAVELYIDQTFKLISQPPLGEIEKDVRRFHLESLQANQRNLFAAFCCGVLLLKAKAQIKHGGFEEWKKKSFADISNATLKRYHTLAGNVFEKIQNEDHLARLEKSGVVKLLPVEGEESKKLTVSYLKNGDSGTLNFQSAEAFEFPASRDAAVALYNVLHTVTDGKTMLDLYRSQRLIRDAMEKGGDMGKRGQRRTNAEIEAEQNKADARKGIKGLNVAIDDWVERKLYTHIDNDSQLDALSDSLHVLASKVDGFRARRAALKKTPSGGSR